MRRALPLIALASTSLFTLSAQASPFSLRNATMQDPAPAPSPVEAPTTTEAPTTADPATPAPATTEAAPTTAPAVPAPEATPAEPASEDPAAEGPTDETQTETAADEGDDPTGEGEGEGELESLEDARDIVTEDAYNQHGIGARGGLTLVPTWILSSFLASHTNALCRGESLNQFGVDRGLTRMDGCNFYVGGEYIYRRNRNLDIVASVGWQNMKTPDGYWLDKDEWADGCTTHDPANGCNLAAADYTEVNVSFLFVEADFIGRATVAKGKDVEFQIGGGAGLGLGVILGKGVFQTPIGGAIDPDDGVFKPVSPTRDNQGNPVAGGIPDFDSCRELQDLGDLRKCTPHYFDDPDTDQNGDGMEDAAGNLVDPPTIPDSDTQGPGMFAQCDDNGCNPADLQAFGSRFEQGDIPPVIPVVNLILSTRVIIKDTVGLNLQGGFNTGFYFGGSLQYFFGGGGGQRKGSTTFFKPSASQRIGAI